MTFDDMIRYGRFGIVFPVFCRDYEKLASTETDAKQGHRIAYKRIGRQKIEKKKPGMFVLRPY